MSQSAVGTIFNAQRSSLHDGSGMRDLIFLKGCPLQCEWCINPESQHGEPELSCRPAKCIDCRVCMAVCPTGVAAVAAGGRTQMDRAACRSCFACVRACCSDALSRTGEEFDTRTLMERVMAQHMSRRAEGGVAFSGGEPLVQPDFAAELLQRLREEGVGMALEICGYASSEAFQKAAPFCQLILLDLKCMASEVHRQYTGVDNRRVLDNLMALSRELPDLPLQVRIPLTPGINDGREQLSETVQLPRRFPPLTDYELLPYYNWGEGKYRQLDRNYPLAGLEPPDRGAVRRLSDELRAELGLWLGQE